MHRRAVLAAIPTIAFAGCTDFFTGDQVEFSADTAVVADDALEATDYEHQNTTEDEIRRDIENVDREVVVTNVMSEYSRSLDLVVATGELARFTVMATPVVEVGPVGPLNPVADMDNDELAELVQEEYSEINNIAQIDERQVQLAGEQTTVDRFRADAVLTDGTEIEVHIHIAQARSEEDFLITIAVHPSDLDEQDRIDQLVTNIQHPA